MQPYKRAPLVARGLAGIVDLAIAAIFFLVPFPFVALIGTAYFWFRDAWPMAQGQSFGKRLCKIQVVSASGQTLSRQYRLAFKRSFPLTIPVFQFWDLACLLGKSGRRWGDRWAGTEVIIYEAAHGKKTLVSADDLDRSANLLSTLPNRNQR